MSRTYDPVSQLAENSMAASDQLVLSAFDDVFGHIGQFGKYQILLYVFIAACSLSSGWTNMLMIFVGAKQDHWCDVPALRNLTIQQQRYVSIPIEEGGSGDGYDQCRMYDFRYENFTHEQLVGWNRTIMIQNASIVPCTSGWVFDRTKFTSTIVSQWSLVCDRKWLEPLSGTIYMTGIFFGVLITGALSDRYGRKYVSMLGIVSQVVFGAAGGLAPNFPMFCIFRFFSGAATLSTYSSVFVMGMECIGPRYRMSAGIVQSLFPTVGMTILSCLSYGVRNHQHLQLILGLQQTVLLLAWPFLSESPRWLESQNRHAEAQKILRKIAKINGRKIAGDIVFKNAVEDEKEDGASSTHYSLLDLFRYPNIRKNTIIFCFAWFTNSVVYFGLTMNMGALASDLHLNTILSALVEIPAIFLSWFLLMKVGRRYTFTGFLIFGGLACLGMIPLLYITDTQTVLTVLSLIGKACICASFNVAYVYTAEVFPTPVRNMALGCSSSSSRVGGMVAPQMGLLREEVWLPLPSLLYGVLALCTGIASFFLPETLNQKLPETLTEGEEFGRSNGTELKGIGCGPLFSSSGRKRKSGYNFPETPKKGNIEL